MTASANQLPRPRCAVLVAWLTALLLVILVQPAQATYLVDERTSGAWQDAQRSGEGFALEVLGDGRAVVYWFTYDDVGGQQWMVGQGVVQGNLIQFDTLLRGSGAVFGPDFDPDQLQFETRGSAQFEFSSCQQGEARLQVGNHSLVLPITRITTLDGMRCPVDRYSSWGGLSGSFFPAQRSGEGFVVQILDGDGPAQRALIYWFTFDDQGQPMWLLGVAIAGDHGWQIEDMRRPIGGRFGDAFNPADVQSTPWGSLHLALSCDGGQASYQALSEVFGSGELDLSRLTRLARLPCANLLSGQSVVPPAEVACGTARSALPAAILRNGGELLPVNYSQYLPAADCAPARHPLNVELSIEPTPIFATNIVPTLFGFAQMATFPRVSVELINDGSVLIPLQRDMVRGGADGSYWNVLFDQGLVWSEPGDGFWSRASLPITLVSDYYNESHSGALTFLYRHDRITGLRFQVGQELSTWNQGDYWGHLPVQANFGGIESSRADTAREQARSNRVQDLPERPLDDLIAAADEGTLDEFKRFVAPGDVSATGIVLDGVLYLDAMPTRFGAYPFPGQHRLGAFSVTKSASAALALLHLAQRYGEEVLDYRIRDYVDVTAQHNGWDQVTFAHAIDMATGIGDANPNPNNSLFADENDPNNPDFGAWGVALTAQAKLDISFRYDNLPWGPGEVVRYNTMHTYVLAAAMDALVKQREGADAHLWDLIEADVLSKLGIDVLPTMHTHEVDGSVGLPLGGVGLWVRPQDIAKISLLFDAHGQWQGEQLLHPELTQSALYRGDNNGLRAARFYQVERGNFTQSWYNRSFWGLDYAPNQGCSPIVPGMEGFGGNLVLVPPNGVIAFRFADGDFYDPGALAITSDRLRPYCPAQ